MRRGREIKAYFTAALIGAALVGGWRLTTGKNPIPQTTPEVAAEDLRRVTRKFDEVVERTRALVEEMERERIPDAETVDKFIEQTRKSRDMFGQQHDQDLAKALKGDVGARRMADLFWGYHQRMDELLKRAEKAR